MKLPKYSVIVPVYNRPQEVDELLDSLTRQTYQNFEVIVVEDGSSLRCDEIVDRYRDELVIHYYFKQNSGPGPTRNFGFAQARGNYFVVFDSDCILPASYFDSVERRLAVEKLDAWGGPDRAHENFTNVQRAMAYTMSSLLTTGGIRGGKKHVGWFQPRSYNMGLSREVYKKTGGFKFDRYAEDIEFSIRMRKAGFNVGLIAEAFVYHKRRTNFSQFCTQVYNFGRGRALVGREHPDEVKLTHWFPSLFLCGCLLLLLIPFIHTGLFMAGVSILFLYLAAIFMHSWAVNKSLVVAVLSIPSAVLQLGGYGAGFLKEQFVSTPRKEVTG